MVKRHRKNTKVKHTTTPESPDALIAEIQDLRAQQHYAQALKKLDQLGRLYPEAAAPAQLPSKGELLQQLGEHQLANEQFKVAERSLQQAIEATCFSAYYPLAKLYLRTDRDTEAYTLLHTAWTDGTLPKTLGGAYLKVLLLTQDRDTVAETIATHANRFYADHCRWADLILTVKSSPNEPSQDTCRAFKRLKRKITPDEPDHLWQTYAMGKEPPTVNFCKAMGFPLSPRFPIQQVPTDPAVRVIAWDYINRHKLSVSPQICDQLEDTTPSNHAVLLQVLDFADQGHYDRAGHALAQLDWDNPHLPEGFQTFAQQILHLGAEIGWRIDDLRTAESLLSLYLRHFGFDPTIAVKWMRCLGIGEQLERQRLYLQRIRQWLDTEARQQQPDLWSEDRVKQVRCEALCHEFISYRTATSLPPKTNQLLEEAESLCPDHFMPHGCRGLYYLGHGQPALAVEKLVKGVEGDVKGEWLEFYVYACKTMEEQNQWQRLADFRQQFGERYDDEPLSPATQLIDPAFLAIPEWKKQFLDPYVASFLDYGVTVIENVEDEAGEALSRNGSNLRKFEPFLESWHDLLQCYFCWLWNQSLEEEPSPRQTKVGGKIPQLSKAFETLYSHANSVDDQIMLLQLICVSIARFFKRKKGITALFKQFYSQLETLAKTEESATIPAWIARILWDKKLAKFQAELESYLDRQPNSILALAELQLELRLFMVTDALRPLLHTYGELDSSVAQIPLAIATTYNIDAPEYQRYCDQSFQLAQRLQDQGALEALRVEAEVRECRRAYKMLARFSTRGRGGRSFSPQIAQMQATLEEILGHGAIENDGSPIPLPEILASFMEAMEID